MTDQAPGFYRRRVGDVVVTALNDGYVDLPLEALQGIGAEAASALLTARFRRPTPRSCVNAFLVERDGMTVLIDTGSGTSMGPTLGRVPANLAAAGVDPDRIDLVLMTHLHPDHCGGLALADGTARFGKATLGMPPEEAAFWLDEATMTNAPEAFRPYFLGAQAAVKPYAARTRMIEDEAAPGIRRVKLPGHTPGHSGWRIGEGADSLLIWGDVMHVPDVQTPHPDVGLGFDGDIDQARRSRMMALDMAAADRLLIAGMHLHFPAFHHVVKTGTQYELVADWWSPEV